MSCKGIFNVYGTLENCDRLCWFCVSCARAGVLSFVRGHVFDRCREPLVLCRINRPMLDLVTRGILAKVIVTFPVLRRPNRSGYESAAAVRADVLKDVINARSAERALIGANPCFKRIGRQRLVAVLTRWSEFKHAGYALPLFGMNLRATPLLHQRLPVGGGPSSKTWP